MRKNPKVAAACGRIHPTGDGKNDEWRVVTSVGLELIQLVIYNRWGNKVWETYDIAKGWDGTYKGKKQQVEAYGYYIKVSYLNGEKQEIKGNVTLME